MSNEKLKDFVSFTRDELEATLDEVEHRVSPSYVSEQVFTWVSKSYDRNPVAWLAGIAVAVVGTVAAVLWAILDSDD